MQGWGVGVARSRRFSLESEFKTAVESEKNARLRKKYKFYLKSLYLMQLTMKLFLASFITFLKQKI